MTTGEFEYGDIMFGTEENMDDPVHEVCELSHFIHCVSSFLITGFAKFNLSL